MSFLFPLALLVLAVLLVIAIEEWERRHEDQRPGYIDLTPQRQTEIYDWRKQS